MLQNAMRNKMAELQNNRRCRQSPRKRAATQSDQQEGSSNSGGNRCSGENKRKEGRKLYEPPQKRRGRGGDHPEDSKKDGRKKPDEEGKMKKKKKRGEDEKDEVVKEEPGQQNNENNEPRQEQPAVADEQPQPPVTLEFIGVDELKELASRSWLDIMEEDERMSREREIEEEGQEQEEETMMAQQKQGEQEGGGGQTQTGGGNGATNFKLKLLDDDLLAAHQQFGEQDWAEISENQEEETATQQKPKEEAKEEEQTPNLGESNQTNGVGQAEVVSSLPPPGTPQSTTPERASIKFTPNETLSEPRNGWCEDKKVLERREMQLKRMKERPIYKRYLSQITKFDRQLFNKGKKGSERLPNTPNKKLNWSRNSWDQQVKKWKLAIYEWAGMTPTPSVASSYCSSECGDVSDESGGGSSSTPSSAGPSTPKRSKMEPRNKNTNTELKIPSEMTNLCGPFDHLGTNTQTGHGQDTMMEMDTMTGRGQDTLMAGGDESTMKAAPVPTSSPQKRKSYAAAVSSPSTARPIDFSHMAPPKKEVEEPKVDEKNRPKLVPKKRGRPAKK